MAPSRGRARAPRGWSLLGGLLALRLWPPPRATAQDIYSPEDPALCAFVRLQGGAAAAAEEATAEALRATWAADARFLRAAAGEEPFWQHLGTDDEALGCTWLLWVPSVYTFVNVPALLALLRRLPWRTPWSLSLGPAQGEAPRLVSGALVAACNQAEALRMAACLAESSARSLRELGSAASLPGAVELGGFGSFALRGPGAGGCLLAALGVRGWVHQYHLHEAVRQAGGMGQCHGAAAFLLGAAASPAAVLPGPLCAFVPVLQPGELPDAAEVDRLAAMARAAHETWAARSTVFVLPPEDELPPGLLRGLAGLPVSHLPASAEHLRAPMFQSLRLWRLALSLVGENCSWAMSAPLSSYINRQAIQQRLGCFDDSLPWYLGATTAIYTPGEEKAFMVHHNKAGPILSRSVFASAARWLDVCLARWSPEEAPMNGGSFVADYVLAACLRDMGGMDVKNYADVEASFILFDRPAQAMQKFEAHPDPVKQCLLAVGQLATPDDIARVHDRVTWSEWHKSVPCIGVTNSPGNFRISDEFGNEVPYYDERIRLALYYCKAPEMLRLEERLSARLEGVLPRSGRGSMAATAAVEPPAPGRRHLCIFVPSTARERKFVEAAEAAWEHWGTQDVFFVAPSRLSPVLDPQTLLFEDDMDTDYAHLPVRTFLLFEALGRPEWADKCDWYMKADADSFVNVPLLEQRLRCFDPAQPWFLGVPQVAHGGSGPELSLTRFASGGAGYLVSRALLPKVAHWAPFCLLQQLQHLGGTGMEDVALASCMHKWGRVEVASYADPETEVITTEAAANRTRVALPLEPGEPLAVPPCTFVVHALTPAELAAARQNIERARAAAPEAPCRPDAERIRRGGATLLVPAQAAAAGQELPRWAVYGQPELAALLSCAEGAAA